MSKSQDKKVLEMRKALLTKESELVGSENPTYETSGLFRPLEYSQRGEINIKSANEGQIVEAMMALQSRAASRTALGLDAGKHLGYEVEGWINDFKTRLSVINRNDTLAQIELLKTELSKLLTPSQMREIGIEEIAGAIDQVVA